MKKEYKVWFRQIYCSTFRQWLEQMFWCFVVIKVFPEAMEMESPKKNPDGSKDCPYCYQNMGASLELKAPQKKKKVK